MSPGLLWYHHGAEEGKEPYVSVFVQKKGNLHKIAQCGGAGSNMQVSSFPAFLEASCSCVVERAWFCLTPKSIETEEKGDLSVRSTITGMTLVLGDTWL